MIGKEEFAINGECIRNPIKARYFYFAYGATMDDVPDWLKEGYLVTLVRTGPSQELQIFDMSWIHYVHKDQYVVEDEAESTIRVCQEKEFDKLYRKI